MRVRWESVTRYYEAILQQDLLGDWVLSTAHGGLRNRLGALKHRAFPSKEDAVTGLRELDKRRLKRGYVRQAHLAEVGWPCAIPDIPLSSH